MILLLYINPKRINFKLIFGVGGGFVLLSFFFLFDFVEILLRQVQAYNTLNVSRRGAIGSQIFKLPLAIGFIPRIIYLIFTPVPNFSSLHQVYLSMSAFIQIFSFPFLISAFRIKSIELKLKVIFAIFFLGVAISTADFRHVMMYLPFGIILTSISYLKLKENHSFKSKYFHYLFLLSILFFGSIGIAFLF